MTEKEDHGQDHEQDEDHEHNHGHEHDHGHGSDSETADDPRPRVRALQSLLVEKGLVSTDAIDEVIAAYEHDIGPLNGARVVARAWTDPEFERRLLDDANDAIDEFDLDVGVQHIEVKENTDGVHNAVVCTLCSCYPWSLLGLPPTWYKTPAYRSRMVREPRSVLAEFGVELDDETTIDVWDSSSEIRYMVLPRRPDGTDGYDEKELAALVTRDSMIGVDRLDASVATDGGHPPVTDRLDSTNPLVKMLDHDDGPTFSEPWQARAFGLAVALYDDGRFDWQSFQRRLIEEVDATASGDEPGGNYDTAVAAELTYYEQWHAALERLLVNDGLLSAAEIEARAGEFARGDRTAEEFVEGDRQH